MTVTTVSAGFLFLAASQCSQQTVGGALAVTLPLCFRFINTLKG